MAILVGGAITILAVTNRGATTYDASGNANNDAITGATWKNEEECKTGKCLFFDGTGDSGVEKDTLDYTFYSI